MKRIPEKEDAIIENTEIARDEFGHAWGSGNVILKKEQFKALKNGKCVALFDGEYVTFLTLSKIK